MKRLDLERHLRKYGCCLKREGGKHTVWENPSNNESTTVPRHNEIKNSTAKEICKQLDIPLP